MSFLTVQYPGNDFFYCNFQKFRFISWRNLKLTRAQILRYTISEDSKFYLFLVQVPFYFPKT